LTASPLTALRRQLREFVELILVPGLACLAPWPLSYRILRRLAKLRWLYEAAVEPQIEQARRLGWVQSEDAWRLRRRLTTAVDHCDYFLVCTRGDRWLSKHLLVQGDWPAAGEPAILLTFHWGAGFWALRHAAAHGLDARALVASTAGAQARLGLVRDAYYAARNRAISRVMGGAVMKVPGDIKAAVNLLRRGGQLVAAIDVPADQAGNSLPVEVAGLPARLPTGILALAARRSIPVYVFSCGLRWADGKRTLAIRRLAAGDAAGMLAQTASLLDGVIREDPAQWHFWGEAPRFFQGLRQ
jgi:hypothetical protein